MMLPNVPLLMIITLAMLVGFLLSAAWLDAIHGKLRRRRLRSAPETPTGSERDIGK